MATVAAVRRWGSCGWWVWRVGGLGVLPTPPIVADGVDFSGPPWPPQRGSPSRRAPSAEGTRGPGITRDDVMLLRPRPYADVIMTSALFTRSAMGPRASGRRPSRPSARLRRGFRVLTPRGVEPPAAPTRGVRAAELPAPDPVREPGADDVIIYCGFFTTSPSGRFRASAGGGDALPNPTSFLLKLDNRVFVTESYYCSDEWPSAS